MMTTMRNPRRRRTSEERLQCCRACERLPECTCVVVVAMCMRRCIINKAVQVYTRVLRAKRSVHFPAALLVLAGVLRRLGARHGGTTLHELWSLKSTLALLNLPPSVTR